MKTSSHKVVVQSCDFYDRFVLAERIDLSMKYIDPFGSLYGTTVLLKPNLISSGGPRLACTHGGFVAAVVLWFLEQGAKVRVVADSPAFGSAAKVCQKQGILFPCQLHPADGIEVMHGFGRPDRSPLTLKYS